jgi:hypothetical protein
MTYRDFLRSSGNVCFLTIKKSVLNVLGGALAASSPSQWVFISANTMCFLKFLHSSYLVCYSRVLLFATLSPQGFAGPLRTARA